MKEQVFSKAVRQIAKGEFRSGPKRVPVYLRLDGDVVNWFRGQGPGYQVRINEVLRRFVAEMRGCPPDDRVTLAQELFERYYERCFWHLRRDLIVTQDLVPLIVDGLRKYGGRDGFLEASRLCQ